MNRDNIEHFTGCILGGAVGDALGWPIEFNGIDDIVKRYGPAGIMDMVPGECGLCEITDDTQMTLFTAEGLLQAMAFWKESQQTRSKQRLSIRLNGIGLSALLLQKHGINSRR